MEQDPSQANKTTKANEREARRQAAAATWAGTTIAARTTAGLGLSKYEEIRTIETVEVTEALADPASFKSPDTETKPDTV